jgi:7TM diverse intracellular signalling/7TMR-DISM extracellular 2
VLPSSSNATARIWLPPAGADNFESALAALQQTPTTQGLGAKSDFQLQTRQTAWYALDLTSNANQPMVLELAHPSVRSADLYLPQDGAAPAVIRSGRDIAAHLRSDARFPASILLPAHTGTRTVYLRLSTIVPLRGQFIYQTQHQWAAQTGWLRSALTAYLCIALLAASYAVYRAIALRSKAYALYATLNLSIALTAMFISGYGEAWAWPALSNWRGELSTAFACISSGLVLLLAQRAFALDVQAPKLSRALLILGLASVLLGIGGAALDLVVHKTLSELAVAVAITMGLGSFLFAWRTTNRPAMWFLMGYTPVIVGSSITNLAFAGLIPFMPWVLLTMPLGCMLEVPFNFYALHLLEKRRSRVQRSLIKVTQGDGVLEESRQAIANRLSAVPADPHAAAPKWCSFMLLRFEALAPGSSVVGRLDAVKLEQYFHAMMATALASATQVGRWSFHELVLRLDLNESPKAQVENLLTALFAQALRNEPYGMHSRDSGLRIAYAYLNGNATSPEIALQHLSDTLNDVAKINLRKIKVDLSSL